MTAPITFGHMRRGKPESWALLRATDGRALAFSDTAGGAVKSANALWPGLDASEAPTPSSKLIRDRTGAIVAIVLAREDIPNALSLINAARGTAPAPAKDPPPMPKAKVCPPSFDTPATDAPKRAGKARTPIVHLVMPDALRAQIEGARDAIEAATTVRPSASDVVRSALAIGLPAIVKRTSA